MDFKENLKVLKGDFSCSDISAMDHAMKLKFSSYVHLQSINKMCQDRYA